MGRHAAEPSVGRLAIRYYLTVLTVLLLVVVGFSTAAMATPPSGTAVYTCASGTAMAGWSVHYVGTWGSGSMPYPPTPSSGPAGSAYRYLVVDPQSIEPCSSTTAWGSTGGVTQTVLDGTHSQAGAYTAPTAGRDTYVMWIGVTAEPPAPAGLAVVTPSPTPVAFAWPDGNHAGSWHDPSVFVVGLVLIGATFIGGVGLLVNTTRAVLDADADGDRD